MPIPRDPPRRRSTHLLSVEPPLWEELFGPGTPEGFGAVDAPDGGVDNGAFWDGQGGEGRAGCGGYWGAERDDVVFCGLFCGGVLEMD